MRLRTRLSLAFCGGIVAILAVAVAVQSLLLTRHARVAAESAARGAVEELQRSVQRRLDELAQWASEARAETAAGRYSAALTALEARLGRDAVAFVVGPDGKVAWHSKRGAGSFAAALTPAATGEIALVTWVGASALAAASSAGERPRVGVMAAPFGPALGASTPLGDKGAQLVVLRGLRPQEAVTAQHGVSVEVVSVMAQALPDVERAAISDLLLGHGPALLSDERGATQLTGLVDPVGRVTLVARARAQRVDGGLQAAWLRETTLWMLAIALVGLLLLLRLLEVQVLAPVRVLQQHALRIGRTDHGRVEIRLDRNDELGELATSLNGMLRSLDTARQEVARTARHAGMSDVARGVVHSIGNVLTSVNVSAHVVARELSNTGVGDMRLLIDELRQHESDLSNYLVEDQNGRFLVPFLDAMASSLEDFQTRCAVELESVEKGIRHAVDLIRSMDKYASGGSFVEEVDVEALVGAAIDIACLSRGGVRGVEIVRDFKPVERPCLDRHKLTTVLIHLVSNALDALEASTKQKKRLEVALFPAGHERFVIEVSDTGVGIQPEHLDSLFSSGFTTKSDAAGQGLHTAANLCREMGASIGAVSEGGGTGATFKLRLPYQAPTEGQASAVDPPSLLPSLAGNSVQFDRRKPTSR